MPLLFAGGLVLPGKKTVRNNTPPGMRDCVVSVWLVASVHLSLAKYDGDSGVIHIQRLYRIALGSSTQISLTGILSDFPLPSARPCGSVVFTKLVATSGVSLLLSEALAQIG